MAWRPSIKRWINGSSVLWPSKSCTLTSPRMATSRNVLSRKLARPRDSPIPTLSTCLTRGKTVPSPSSSWSTFPASPSGNCCRTLELSPLHKPSTLFAQSCKASTRPILEVSSIETSNQKMSSSPMMVASKSPILVSLAPQPTTPRPRRPSSEPSLISALN